MATDLEVTYDAHFLCKSEADNWLNLLLTKTKFIQNKITIYGKTHNVPRLEAWYGAVGYPYSPRVELPACPVPSHLDPLFDKVSAAAGFAFNCVLMNYYRDGKDHVSWHADDEKIFGEQPTIASLSLGQERRFYIRRKSDHSRKVLYPATHGSLLVMSGRTQEAWEHSVPKDAKADLPRLNLTFRPMVEQ